MVVGYREIGNPSTQAKLFIIALILVSVVAVGYAVSVFTEYLISFLALPFISRAIGPEKLGLVGFTLLFGILMFLIIEFGQMMELFMTTSFSIIQLSRITELLSFMFSLIDVLFDEIQAVSEM